MYFKKPKETITVKVGSIREIKKTREWNGKQ